MRNFFLTSLVSCGKLHVETLHIIRRLSWLFARIVNLSCPASRNGMCDKFSLKETQREEIKEDKGGIGSRIVSLFKRRVEI